MFGYVQIRKPELKVKDYEAYHGFYCGLCSQLKRQYGFLGQVTLTYDMTFLVLLLTSVYDVPVKESKERCMVHPAKKHLRLTNEITEYAADLNMILTYHHLRDDKEDEGSKKAWLGMKLYHGKKKKASAKYARQDKVISQALEEMAGLEKSGNSDIFALADCFGKLMAEIFIYKEDVFSQYFHDLGFHLGRFIYIMDAYDDLEADKEKGCFNPLLACSSQKGYEKWVEGVLLDEIAAASAAYQKLPCLEYADILGNILYAGVWNRYDDIQTEKKNSGKIQEELEE